MTISRCDLVDVDRLTLQFVSSNESNTIGVEVMLDGNTLMDMTMDRAGQTSVLFDTDGGQFEFDLTSLKALLDRCIADLTAWRDQLVAPGGMWEAGQ